MSAQCLATLMSTLLLSPVSEFLLSLTRIIYLRKSCPSSGPTPPGDQCAHVPPVSSGHGTQGTQIFGTAVSHAASGSGIGYTDQVVNCYIYTFQIIYCLFIPSPGTYVVRIPAGYHTRVTLETLTGH